MDHIKTIETYFEPEERLQVFLFSALDYMNGSVFAPLNAMYGTVTIVPTDDLLTGPKSKMATCTRQWSLPFSFRYSDYLV
jgi:hypothetical protein